MLTRLQYWLDRLELDPDKTSLRRLLPSINVVLVLLVIISISFSAVGLLRKLSNEQGLARVQLAAASAREELRRTSEDALKQTRNLARDATLLRLTQEDPASLVLPLRRACRAAGLDVCAIWRGDERLAEASRTDDIRLDEADWTALLNASKEQGERFSVVTAPDKSPMVGTSAVMQREDANRDAIRVMAVRLLDDALAADLSQRVDLPVRFINYRSFSAAKADAYTRLNSAALSDGRYAAERIAERDVFAASVPVFASTGEAIALIDAEMPTDASDANARELIRRLLITAVLVAALATGISLLAAQLVIKPVRRLTEAATRLAQGDFSTSIPMAGPTEVGVLARTLEDMRRNLVVLTSALRRSEAEAQAVLSGATEGVFAVDRLRKLTYLNPQAAKLLKVDATAALGQFCGDVLKPCADKLGNKPCDTHCPIVLARLAGRAQAQEQLQLGDVRRSVIITSSDLVDGMQVQVLRDETEAEAIRRARDAVLANISHEFRTPLAAQLASIELLQDGFDDLPKEKMRELVTSLERGTHRLTALIDNLLESVRIEAGQLNIRQQQVAIADVIDEARVMIDSLLAQRGQVLNVTTPDDLPLVNGDEVRLTQVMVNLLANANKYAPEKSTIRVGAEVQESMLHVWVEDEGRDLPAGEVDTLFERFSRGPNEEPEPGGLGLGLWISKSIIERHGGHITANRTPAGCTRFSFTLPLEHPDDAAGSGVDA